MTLKLPTVKDPEVQRALDVIAQQFPLQGSNLAGVLRLAQVADQKISEGTVTAEWGGAFVFSNTVTVEHGLGTTPQVVLATLQDNESKVLGWVTTREITATKITMYGMYFSAPAAGTKAQIHWIAIG